MTWGIGTCEACGYSEPDRDGGTCYCVFRTRRRASWFVRLFRGNWARQWRWECDDCADTRYRKGATK